jgi:3',5'-cyclic AMP phosphodiesterase CpdA
VARQESTNGAQPTLWAVSDLHTGHLGNKPVTESLYPASPDDWLIVAGDVAERTDEIRWALDLLRRRFAKVIWAPGNHELWTTNRDPVQLFGKARYDYLVNMCDEMGVVTPEHPFPVWNERGGPATIVPMFLLYDYSFLPAGAASKAEGLAIARERNVVATRAAGRHPCPARAARLGHADRPGEPLPAGAGTL